MDARYPIGQFEYDVNHSRHQVPEWIEEIRTLPARLEQTVSELGDEQLDMPYREGGWTIRQLVHHVADSHMNAYIRFKLALTEETPTIKPYEQKDWAQLPDSKLPVAASLKMLEGIHERLTVLLQSLTDDQLNRAFLHPESGLVTVEKNIGLYAWHGRHHLAHIQRALAH